jgi:tetratricopeptide (TPR) repeat protein
MKNQKAKSNNSKISLVTLFESVIFLLCLAVIVLRTMFTEAPSPLAPTIQAAINDTVFSLVLSGVLFLALILFVLVRLFTNRLTFKFTLLEAAFVILVIAAIISSLYASNKRAAINASVTFIAPLSMVILLSRLLDSHAKIKILLIVIVSLGIVAAWQSAEQQFVSNRVMVEQYQQDPNSILQPLGIQPGTLNAMLLEHRIMSKSVRASFTTANSAGSFAILASFVAIAILSELLKTRKLFPSSSGNRGLSVLLLAVIIFSLILTRSKGAIAAFLVAVIVFGLLLISRKTRTVKNVVLALCVIGVIAAIPLAAWYGGKFDRLPGGNSMLVRWQYWLSSAQMAKDRILTGVGPGNFAVFYTRYKIPAAPETVSDPHSFLLGVLTQYGLPGLFGLLMFLLVPLWRSSLTIPDISEKTSGGQFTRQALICALVPAAAMAALRPFLLPSAAAANIDEQIYVFVNDYIAPIAAFIVGFALLIKSIQTITAPRTAAPSERNVYAIQNTNVTAIALFCGILGFLIHNLIDFAIFEPGVLTTFCALFGCLIALDSKMGSADTAKAGNLFKVAATAGFIVFGFAYFNYAFLPVAKSTAKVAKAIAAVSSGRLLLAHNLLEDATYDDRLSPEAPYMNGKMYLQYFTSPMITHSQLYTGAEEALSIAIERNPDDYKIFDALAELYSLRSNEDPNRRDYWLNQAFDAASMAVSLYPGNADLHFRLAALADDLGRMDDALKHYEKTVEIEDAFRKQFRMMYPDRKPFSRLGEEKYYLAGQRILELYE